MAFTLRKPASTGSTVNPPSASTLIKGSGGTFTIKVTRRVVRWRVNEYEQTTGDSDSDPRYEHNGLQDGYYTIFGKAIASAAVGIAALKGSSNPGTFKLLLDNNGAAGSTETVTLLVIEVLRDWRKTGPSEAIVIQGIVTDTVPSTVEGSS